MVEAETARRLVVRWPSGGAANGRRCQPGVHPSLGSPPDFDYASTFVFTLLTFCPPAPPLLANAMVTSSLVTRRGGSAHSPGSGIGRVSATRGPEMPRNVCTSFGPLTSCGVSSNSSSSSYCGAAGESGEGMSGEYVADAGWDEVFGAGTDPRLVVFVIFVPVFVIVFALSVRAHEPEPVTTSCEPFTEPLRSKREGESGGRAQPMCASACDYRSALELAPRLGWSCRRSAR